MPQNAICDRRKTALSPSAARESSGPLFRGMRKNRKEAVMELDNERLTEMYRRVLRIRVFEETVVTLQSKGEVPRPAHNPIGQGGEIRRTCQALPHDDYIVRTHR